MQPTIPDLYTSTSGVTWISDPDEPASIRVRAFFDRLGATRDPGLGGELERLAQTCDAAASPYGRPQGGVYPLGRGRLALAVASYNGGVAALLGVDVAGLPEMHAKVRQRIQQCADAAGVKPAQVIGQMAADLPAMLAGGLFNGWNDSRSRNGLVDHYASAIVAHFPPVVIADVVAKTAELDVCYVLAMIVSPTTLYSGALPLGRFDDLVGPVA